jgi:HPt (histidine-containing phosphotransfer) domain-containing protein
MFDVDAFVLPEAGRQIDASVLDLEHLDRYTMGDRALERELLGLFLAQTRQYADRLGAIDDARDWKLATHSIKGAARSIGAGRIAACAQGLEDLDPFRDTARRQALTAELLSHIAVCESVIARLLGPTQGAAA